MATDPFASKTNPSSSSGAFLSSFLGLEGKVALITGSTGGLGRAIAETLCQAGCNVIINGRNKERTEKAARDIAATCHVQYGSRVVPAHGDTTIPEQAEAIVAKIEKLDILVNNAGINLPEASFEEQYAPESWQKISAVNMNGPMTMTQLALPLLKQSQAGRIINMSSMIGHVGSPTNALYTMTKAAMLLFSKSLAADMAKRFPHITVNTVSPGAMETDMNEKFTKDQKALKAINSAIPMGRMGKPDEVAGAVLFLASSAASYVTGTDVLVDGGYTAI